MIMLKNHVKVLGRTLWNNRFSTFLNMVGLAIGMACYLLLFQYINFQLSYDDFHENKNDIYRLQRNVHEDNGRVNRWAVTTYNAGPTMKLEFPEIKEASRSFFSVNNLVKYEDRIFKENRILITEPSFFKIFSFPFQQGDPASGLDGPNKIMLSETTARKFFGDKNPVGQSLKISSRRSEFSAMVTGIFKDVPANSHIKFDMVLSLRTAFPESHSDWIASGMYTHFLLNPGADFKALEAKLPEFIKKYILPTIPRSANWVYHLQPLGDIYLYSNLTYDTDNGNGKTVYFLLIIALLILVISWINYVNLSTAHTMERAREVGMRKVLGSTRWQLIRQFLNESLLANIIPTVIAIILSVIFLPYLKKLTGQDIPIYLNNFWYLLHLVLLYAAGSLLSGLYPALVLSSFPPAMVLTRSKFNQTTGGSILKKVLVTFQFSAAAVLVILTLAVFKQIRYMTQKDLGINTDDMVALTLPDIPLNQDNIRTMDTFKIELLRYPGIKNVSGSLVIPGAISPFQLLAWKENTEFKDGKILPIILVDHEFLSTYQVRFLSGRNFSREHATDTQAVILNEAAVAALGYESPEGAMNQKILLWNVKGTFEIIGIIKNYHQQSLKENFDPLLFRLYPAYKNFYSIKLNPDKTKINETITLIKQKWEDIFPGHAFDYFFLDDYFNRQYKADYQFGNVLGLFVVLAVIITCLGLLGLSYFSSYQRRKEIAIRKSIGASIGDILVFLVQDIVKLVITAVIIAWPIAYLIIDHWLKNYAYRIDVPYLFFILSGLLLVIITLVTIAYHTFTAARANPVDALKEE
jgi:putative ABC transport system permease protein